MAAATVTAAGPVADGGIDVDNPAAAAMSADDAASSMLEKGKHNKNGTKDIDWYSGIIRGITTWCGLSVDSLSFAT